MREALSQSLVNLAKNNEKVVLLTGDHGYALFDEFRKSCPKQYINAGIAEQNMVGMAAGLARVGFRPIVYGLSAFIPIRVLEQIKLDVCHDDLPVIFLGDGAGFVYSTLGTSHQSTEDIAATRAIPKLSILSPADRYEMVAVMKHASELNGPAYIRIGKSDCGDVHSSPLDKLEVGGLLKLRSGRKDLPGLIATGSLVRTSLDIGNEMNLSVWSAPTLKPINTNDVINVLSNTNGIVTIEEHSIYGGLGGIITEIACEKQPQRILRIGVQDCFSEKCGTYKYLLNEHGLDKESIVKKINTFFNN